MPPPGATLSEADFPDVAPAPAGGESAFPDIPPQVAASPVARGFGTTVAHVVNGQVQAPSTPDPGLAGQLRQDASSWLHVPVAALNAGGAQLEAQAGRVAEAAVPSWFGIREALARRVEPRAQADVQAANDYLEQTTGATPSAREAAMVGKGLTPFLFGPAVGATSMGEQTMHDAHDAGASDARAVLAGIISAGAGAVAPVAGRTVAPVGEALARPVADAAGALPAALVRGGVEGTAQGAVLGGGNIAATAAYDPEAAARQISDLPTTMGEMALISALAHGGPAAMTQVAGARPLDGARAFLRPFDTIAENTAAARDLVPGVETQHGAPVEDATGHQVRGAAEAQAVAELPQQVREARAQALAEEEVGQPEPQAPPAPAEPAAEPARDVDLDAAQRAATAGGLKGGFYRDPEGKIVYDPARPAAEVPPPPEEVPQPVTMGRIGPSKPPPVAPEPTPAERAIADEQEGAGAAAPRPAEAAEPISPQPSNDTQAPPLRGPGSDRTKDTRAVDTALGRGSRPAATPSPEPRESGAAYPRLTSADLRAQLESLPIAKRTPGFTDTHMALIDARARSAGLSTDEYVGRRIAGVRSSVKEPSLNQRDTLDQRLEVPSDHLRHEYLLKQWKKAHGDRSPTPGNREWQKLVHQADMVDEAQGRRFTDDTLHQEKPLADARVPNQAGAVAIKRGAVQFLSDGRAMIHAFEHADRSTVLHELAHVFRRDLSAEDLTAAEKWLGVTNGEWTRPHEERFARGFERWTRDGIAPTPELRGVFRRFYDWLHEVYKSVTGSQINVRLSPAAKAVFERLLTPDAMRGKDLGTRAPAVEEPPAPGAQPAASARPEAMRVAGDGDAAPAGERAPVAPASRRATFEGDVAPHPAEPPADRSDVPAQRGPVDGSVQARDRSADAGSARAAEGAPVERDAGTASDDARLGTENRRPDLATPGEDPEARKAYVEARNEMPEIETRKRSEIKDAATARVDKDPEGMLKRLIGKATRGEAFNAEDMGSAQVLMKRLYQDRRAEHDLLARAYQLAGNEGAVAQGMRVDMLQTPEGRLAEARSIMALPRPRFSKRVEKLRADLKRAKDDLSRLEQKDPDSAQRIRNRIKKMELELGRLDTMSDKQQARDAAHLKRLGFDLDEANPEWARDPDRFQQFIAALEATRGGLPAVAREIYVGVKHLSGTVAGKKVVADAISVPYRALVRHLELLPASAKRLIGKGSNGEVTLRELGATWTAVGPALKRAAVNAMESLRTQQHPKELMSPEDAYHYPTMRGVKGEVMRHAFLLSTVRAIDAFTRSFVAHIEVAGRAYRSALDSAGERLSGEQLAQHVANEVNDFASESWGQAREAAMHATFTEKPVELVRRINRAKYAKANTITGKAIKLAANLEFPFTTIPSNIVKQGLEDWTPGISDAITIAKALRRDPSTGEWLYDGNKFNEDVAKAAVRWGTLSVLGGLAAAGILTGADDPRNPLSVHVAGHWLSYRHLGPIARVIGAAADAFAPHKAPADNTTTAKAVRVLKGAGEQTTEMPVIRFAVDLAHAAAWNDGWTRYAADQTANLTPEPSIVHQGLNAAQDEVRHRANLAKGAPFLDRYLGYLHDRLTSNSGKPVKVGGAPLVKDRFDSDIGTYLWRIASPMALGNREGGTAGEKRP